MYSVTIREFYESDTYRDRYEMVHLQYSSAIEVTQRQAICMTDFAMGIVTIRHGFVVRVSAAQYDSAVKMRHPNDSERLLGTRM